MPAVGPTKIPIQWVPEVMLPPVKRPKLEASYHSPPSVAEIKNEWSWTIYTPSWFSTEVQKKLPLKAFWRLIQVPVLMGVVQTPNWQIRKKNVNIPPARIELVVPHWDTIWPLVCTEREIALPAGGLAPGQSISALQGHWKRPKHFWLIDFGLNLAW